MAFLWRAQKEIQQMVNEYLTEVENCLDTFQETVVAIIDASQGREKIKELVERTHRAESRADDLRRTIESKLYEGTLIPAHRGDLLGLLETMDKIPNRSEAVVFNLYLQRVLVPESIRAQLKGLVESVMQCCRSLSEAVKLLFEDVEKVLSLCEKVDKEESDTDRQERELLETIFELPLDLAEKLLLRDVVKDMAGIADRAENVSDRLTVIAGKLRM